MNKIVEQKYLKTKGTIVLITFMNMIVPLSLDMYLPAVPQMTILFNASESMVNFTLVGFFFFMAVGILLFGPISDKYGRKPLLIAGTFVYLIFSAACALAPSIEILVAARIVQALGAGCMIAVSTALIKDIFQKKNRDTVLAVVQAMTVIAPMVAPIIGAWIITISGWRTTFWFLTILAFLCLIAIIFLVEPLRKEDRYNGHVLSSLKGLVTVGRNKGFTLFLMANGALSAPYMAYIAVCSYIYIDYFSLSETTYSYYFAINSATSILGPILYIKIKNRIKAKTLMSICIMIALLCGVLIITIGWAAPIIFLLSFLPFTIIDSALRPFSTSILFNQQEKDTGSASSLINCTHSAIGSLGMILGTLGWSSFISGLGIILIGFSLISLTIWIVILKKKNIYINGITND